MLFGYKNPIEVKAFRFGNAVLSQGQLDKPEYFMIALVFEYKECVPVGDKACNYISKCNMHNLQ
jgi:hypothetical protein